MSYISHDDRDIYEYDSHHGYIRGHRRGMSEEDATHIMEVDARSKDFWYGDENLYVLQAAIDSLYNSIPGNDYEVDYKESQNSGRLIIRCMTCNNKELTSYDPFITHEKGKSHKKVRQQVLTPKDPNIQAILEKQPHNVKRGIFEPKSLEARVDDSEYSILGMYISGLNVFYIEDFKEVTLCNNQMDRG